MKTQGWRKAKSAANKLMEKGNFTIDDVRNDLANLRDSYEDDLPDVSERLNDVNQKIDATADKFWEQAHENLKNEKYAYLKSKLELISKNTPILIGEDGMIELDPNNPNHVEWFEDEDYPEPTERLEQALVEMKLMREGKLPKKTWDELQKELRGDMLRDMTKRASDQNDGAFRRLAED